MKISNSPTINNYYNKSNFNNNTQPTFGSLGFIFGTYKDCYGVLRETQNTTGMRNDICLKDFADVIKWRFKHFDKVNIMPMNVSDGTEGYLFANAIIRNEGLDTFEKKYSPLKASDVMSNVIENYAKRGLLHLYENEIGEFNGIGINALKEVNKEDYKEFIIPQCGCPERLFKLSNDYRKHFDFRVEDLQSRIIDLKDDGNSVISIRNCLKQSFGETKSALIIKDLAMKMKGASLLITGDYDRKLKLINTTLKDYFTEIKHNIWGLKEYGYFKNHLNKFHI